MTHRVWQSINRKKAKAKLVRKKQFTEPVRVEEPRKVKTKSIKVRRKRLKEDVHPKVLGALRAKPPQVLDRVLSANKEVGEKSGLHQMAPAKGSSRAVLHVKNDHVAMVDGKSATMKGIVKMAYKDEKKINVGQDQNRVEASAKVQKHATLVRDGSGGFKTNPNGVVPPVFKHGNDHTFIHAGHAGDVSYQDVRNLTKTKSHPDGLSLDQIDDASHPTNSPYKKTDKIHQHPVVRAIKAFRKDTGISDLHPGNFGVWTHPHTGERKLVIRDAGFDRNVRKHYGGFNTHGGGGTAKNITQVTGSMGLRDGTDQRQYSMNVNKTQNWKHDAAAANPPSTDLKYRKIMDDKRYNDAQAKFKNVRPTLKKFKQMKQDFVAGKMGSHDYYAAENAHRIAKIKRKVEKKNTGDINTADAMKIRALHTKYAADTGGVGFNTMNKAAIIAGDNRDKRDNKK